jgi:hypothetical protein
VPVSQADTRQAIPAFMQAASKYNLKFYEIQV